MTPSEVYGYREDTMQEVIIQRLAPKTCGLTKEELKEYYKWQSSANKTAEPKIKVGNRTFFIEYNSKEKAIIRPLNFKTRLIVDKINSQIYSENIGRNVKGLMSTINVDAIFKMIN